MTEPATLAHHPLSQAFDVMTDELTEHLDRLLGTSRVIRVDQIGGRYCASIDNGQRVFPLTDNLDTVIRFIRAFAIQTEGVRVDEDSVEFYRMERARLGYSVAVPADNVVPIRDGVGA